MKNQLVGIWILIAISVTGCTKLGQAARINPASIAMPNSTQRDPNCPLIAGYAGERPQAIDLSCFRFPDDSNPTRTATATATGTESATAELNQADAVHALAAASTGRRAASVPNVTVAVTSAERPTAYQLAVQMPTGQDTEDKRIYYRTRLQEILMDQSNRVCQDAKGRIYADRAFSNSVLEAVSSGLSISSSIVGGDLAKSILSGGAEFATGLRSNVNANVYQNQLVSAITKVMDGERTRIAGILDTKKGLDPENFTADEMIRLVNEYHQACSFEHGIQMLLDAAVNKEGRDAIVSSINVRYEIEGLKREISYNAQAFSAQATDLNKPLLERLGVLQLQASQYSQTQAPVPAADSSAAATQSNVSKTN